MKYSSFAALISLVLTTACTHPVDSSGAPSFGRAVETMQASQVVPSEMNTAPPEGSGSQGALAQGRYRTGNTKPLLPSDTSVANPSSN